MAYYYEDDEELPDSFIEDEEGSGNSDSGSDDLSEQAKKVKEKLDQSKQQNQDSGSSSNGIGQNGSGAKGTGANGSTAGTGTTGSTGTGTASSGATAGNSGAATTGSTAGTAGAEAGATAGTSAGAAAGTEAGAAAGTSAGAAAGTGAGAGVATGTAGAGVATGTAGAGVATGTVATAVAAPVAAPLLLILVIVIAVIALIGIIMFFMTAPGMVLQELKQKAADFAGQVASWFGADAAKVPVKEQDIYNVMNYLERMGYDLKGYGFISEDVKKTDTPSNGVYDEREGVIRDENGKITDLDSGEWFGGVREANSEIINLYILSNNYSYIVKNFNNVSTWWGGFAWIQAIGEHIADLFGADNTKWGKGLISIHYEDGTIGSEGDSYQNGILGFDKIEIDAEGKKLKIRKGWGNNFFEYDLDGWTGRYGMPLEFLLSVHIATMKPDLTYEMITEFPTDVDILLRKISGGNVAAAYKTDGDTYVTYEQVEESIHGSKSDDVWNSIVNWFDDNWGGLNDEEVEVLTELGFSNDRDEIKEILTELENTNDYNYDTYVPYISKVTNHWFRNVYFVLSEEEVNTTPLTVIDSEYEALTNERWTLYEMYESGDKVGEYKLYVYEPHYESDGTLKDDGGYGPLYEGTQADADRENIKVVKKQLGVTAKDLTSFKNKYNPDAETENLITLNDNNGWTAYEESTTESEKFERVYTDKEENLTEVQKRIYYKVKLPGNVTQKEDGLRGVTNTKIKDMFLNRYYFTYDGSTETADLIKKAREQLGMNYGAVPDNEEKLNTEISGTSDQNGNPYKIKDLVSKVSITQDSLGAFSMLENTHTLDADYIYKDFKELIVELGYFTKEELSSGKSKLLQWLIPDISSAGFPKRVLDKKENEYGTQLHSREDYEANVHNTLKAAIVAAIANESSIESGENSGNPGGENTSGIGGNSQAEKDLQNAISALDIEGIGDKYVSLGSVGGSSTSLLSLDAWWEESQKMFDVYNSESWVYDDHGHIDGNSLGCNGETTFDQVVSEGREKSTDCSIGASWMLQKLGALKENHTFKSCLNTGGKLSSDNACTDDLMAAGAEVIVPPTGTKFTSAANSGELEPGDILFYKGHVSIYCGDSYETGGTTFCWDTGSTTAIQNKGPYDTSWETRDILLIVRLPIGNRSSGEEYKGYEGDEAVVSPVTGILLDYGTYEDSDEERKNTDKKSKTDKLGYAKILVLNEEIVDQLVSCSDHDTTGLVSVQIPKTLDALDGLSEEEKKLYGYKEFAKNYEDGGIAGNLIYIDGFKCELPGEGIPEDEATVEDYVPGSGEELSMDYFKEKAASTNKECEYEETLYEADTVYNLVSDEVEEKQKTKAEAKNIASLLYNFEGKVIPSNIPEEDKDSTIAKIETENLLVIREGTVIGRTITNKELVEDYRNEEYVKPEEPAEGEDDTREVQGNYLRIIMKADKDTVIEDVESYMKLDDEDAAKETDNFSVVGTVLSKNEWVEMALAYTTSNGADAIFTNRGNLEKFYDLCVEKGVNPEYVFVRGIQESELRGGNGNNYWGYNTPNGSGLWDGGTWENVLGLYCDTIVKYQDPSTWEYGEIMKRNSERKACTENGGIDPLGFGEPDTVGGQQSLYSWIGDDHMGNSPGSGGMYVLYPWGWAGNQYEGENKIIFESKDEFESICGSKHGTSGGSTSSTPTTVWEQGMYTAYQSKIIVKLAKNIFGEKAGTYVN